MKTKNATNGRNGKTGYKGVAIRKDLRLAIYLRDGLACCWCGHALEDNAELSLDHCIPDSKGGGNEPSNLVTCCLRCNKSRQARGLKTFAEGVAHYLNGGVKPADILRHIHNCRSRKITPYRVEAKKIIARRGTMNAVFSELR